VIEPQLIHDPRVLLAIMDSIGRAGIQKSVNLVPGFSPEKVEELATKQKKRWSFFFIDGNHNGDYPLRDAQVCCKYATPDAIVFFHDLAFPDVSRGFLYFRQLPDWNSRIYHTQQIVGVAWRGNIVPPDHVPDPAFNWEIPDHLKMYYNSDDGTSK